MLKFISLGSGSSGNAYFLYTETDGIIIDCGIGFRSMKKYLQKLRAELLHDHNIL